MGDQEKETRGNPATKAKAWTATLSEVERKRDKYQEMFTADAMTRDELRSKLNSLEERRDTAQRELATLRAGARASKPSSGTRISSWNPTPRLPPRPSPPWTPRNDARYTPCLDFASRHCQTRA